MKKQDKKNKINLGTEERPRVVFCESNRFIRVQAIDDENGKTLLFFSTEKETNKNNSFSRKNTDYIYNLSETFAAGLKKKGCKKIIFDRNGKKYHGKVKIFCDIVRKTGILF